MMIPMKPSSMTMTMATIFPLREGIPPADFSLPESFFSLWFPPPWRLRNISSNYVNGQSMAAEEQQDQGEVQTTSPPARTVSVEADSFFPGFHIHEVGAWIGARERPPRLFSSEPSASMRPSSRTPPLSMPRELTAHPAGNQRADRKSTRLNSSHRSLSRMPSSA